MANVAFWLAHGLRGRGVEADILAPSKFKQNTSSFFMTWINKKPYIRYMQASSTLGLITELSGYKGYDIYHAHYCLAPTIACAILNYPFIAHAHGSDLRTVAKKLKYRYFIKYSLKKAKKVLVSTPDLISNARSLGIADPLFFPNPVPEIFRPSKPEIDLHEGFDFVLFHPSRVEWWSKGTDKLIHAFRRVIANGYNIRLVLINYGDDLERTKSLVKAMKLEKWVAFIGPVSQLEMPKYYNSCDIVVTQFNVGHVGLVGLEAFACMKPVIADYRYPEYYGKLPVMQGRSIDEITTSIVRLLENPALARRLSSEGHDYISKYHNLNVVTNKLLEIYKQILN